MSEQMRYAPRDGGILWGAIRAALAATDRARALAERSEQHAAYSELDNAADDLRNALGRVLP